MWYLWGVQNRQDTIIFKKKFIIKKYLQEKNLINLQYFAQFVTLLHASCVLKQFVNVWNYIVYMKMIIGISICINGFTITFILIKILLVTVVKLSNKSSMKGHPTYILLHLPKTTYCMMASFIYHSFIF